MRRPTVRRQQPGVALFPFLAVLICTMGALIVLLVLVVQQARASAALASAAPVESPGVDAEELKRLQEQEEDLQWRAEMLRQHRDAEAQGLVDRRNELAHLEDHIRRLEDEAKRVLAHVEQMRKSGKGKLADSDKAKDQVAEIEREIAEKKKKLDDAQKAALRRRPAYAIVPYEGPNGTSRRPIYIECTEQGIILQPEGVVLGAEDFQGPLGPGNPLDAALRACREHLQRAGLQGEPYPLIIVRPSGALAFGACRTAMKHWESEFGYELVDQDAEIKYPPADPQLAATLKRAIVDARQRQVLLASAMPNRFGAEGRLASFRAADNPEIGTMEDEPGPGTRGGSNGGRGDTRGVPSFASSGTGMGTGPRGATGSGGSGTQGQGGIGERPTAATSSRTGGTSGSSPENPNQSGTGASGEGQPPTGGQSYAGGSPGGNAPSGASTEQGAGATSMMSSGARAGSPGASGSSQGGASGGSSGSSSASEQSAASDTPSTSMSLSPQMAKARKAITNRGENWGLPNSSPKATGITRPIRVECYADQLRLLPEKGEARTPLVVPIEDDVSQNLDAFVDAVWRHMDRWGLAVLGGYWKPVLTFDVRPGGEQRFAELQLLLRGSGIEIERKP